ncbi:MAG: DUF4317 domain-containing protein [Eubacteriales bacterium]|nr:DUF4317 domain-containing protein [Eubacteriales bacterium]
MTKKDVLELRRRLTKNECTFGRMCGCYVNSGKQVVLKFGESFTDLEEDEFYKYLEIAKKTLSGTLGNNLLELEFERGEQAEERQRFLLTLKAGKNKNDELLDRLYEQVIEQYTYPGNYLILVFHDIYDVMTKTSDNSKLDESEETYEYLICAICPVELSKPALGYREEENRIGARLRDWIVGLPDLGFVYPAFSGRSSDVNAVLYYVKNGKSSHPEFVENVLGCRSQRTAAEDKQVFHSIVQRAFGEDEEQADQAFLKIQKTISGLVAEQEEDDSLPPVSLTPAVVADVIADAELPEPVREQIERGCTQAFGELPPAAHNVLDAKLVAESVQREHTAALEQKLAALQEKLAEQTGGDEAPWDGGAAAIELRVPEDKAAHIKTEVVDGQKCLLIPLGEGESARINGIETDL